MINIKELRLIKKVGQTELANYIGVSVRTIQHSEKGTNNNITVDKLDRINSFFGLEANFYDYSNFQSKSISKSKLDIEKNSEKEFFDKIMYLENILKLKEE
jgi:transcriptional regulator with XRE-family HTH domain